MKPFSLDFADFMEILPDVRKKLQEVRQHSLFDTFTKHDKDDSGELSFKEIEEILSDMGIAPKDPEFREKFEVFISDADLDNSGSLAFREFQKLVERMREAHHQRVAWEQHEVARQMGLTDPKLFAMVRDNIVSLRNQFLVFDADGSGYLEPPEIWAMLAPLGMVPKTYGEKGAMTNILAQVESAANPGKFSFVQFVQVVNKIREMQKLEMKNDLRRVFDHYDRDRSGELTVSEISKTLEDLKMMPHNSEEQTQIQDILEEVGNCCGDQILLDFEAFTQFMQLVREKKLACERHREKHLACGELGMSERELSDCRIAFSTLDQTGGGRLQIDAIRKVMVLLRRKISSDRLRLLFNRMDEDSSGYIEFMEFLRLMKAIDLEIF